MAPESTIGIEERELDDAALEALAEAYASPPPAQLRERLMAAARRDGELHRTEALARRTRMVGAIAAAMALVFAGLFAREMVRGRERAGEISVVVAQNVELASQLEQQGRRNLELASQLEQQGRALVGLREALDAQAEVLRLVGAPRVLTASLAPQGGAAGAGRVLVDAATGEAAIVLSGLPPPAAGKAYELWAIRGKKAPEPAGLVSVTSGAGAAVRIPKVERPREVTAFAVSIEPSGGSPAPTGPIVLVGPVAS